MTEAIKYKISGLLNSGNDLSQKVVKNILLSFGVKGGSILTGLLLVPLTISYVSTSQYGVWLTISSVVNWLSFFDIGLGNGLRNKLASILSNNEFDEAKKYISTTYATLGIIASILFACIWIINPFINWNDVFNVPITVGESLQPVLLIALGSFCLQFVAQLINTILTATHHSALAGFILFVGQVAALLAICLLKFWVPGSLLIVVSVLTLVPIAVMILANGILFRTRLRHIAPSFQNIKFKYIKEIMNTGGQFFFVQIGALILLQMNNIIITKLIGPKAVTEFNVAYKLFSVISMVFVIIVTPYWSAFTTAYTKGDFTWMRTNITLMRKIWAALSLCSIFLLWLSPHLYRWWLGDKVVISNSLSLAITLYLIVFMWQTLHVYFLNGVGKIRLQLILVSIAGIVNLLLAIYLGKQFGLPGIITANTIVFVILGTVFTIQTEYIIQQKATKIWLK